MQYCRAKTGDVVTLGFSSNETISSNSVSIAGHTVTAVNTSGNNWTASYTMTGTMQKEIIPFSALHSAMLRVMPVCQRLSSNYQYSSSNVVFDKTAPTLSR
jgi:hypothetical protein